MISTFGFLLESQNSFDRKYGKEKISAFTKYKKKKNCLNKKIKTMQSQNDNYTNPSFLPTDRPVLSLIGSNIPIAISSVSGLSTLQFLLESNSTLINRYPEIQMLDLLIQAKKKLSKSGEMSWKNVREILESLRDTIVPDPVFSNLIESMRKNPNRYETNTGLKLEVATTKVVDSLMQSLAEATDLLSHPAQNFRTIFDTDVPFNPIVIDNSDEQQEEGNQQQQKQ